jgi:acyl-coenzyme A synthetase/AMP-(fatty) acid ligase
MDNSATVDHVAWQLDRFRAGANQPAMAWRGRVFTYGELLSQYKRSRTATFEAGVKPGDSVAVIGDYSPAAVMCLLALIDLRCVLVPLSWASQDQHASFLGIAEVDHVFALDAEDHVMHRPNAGRRGHSLLEQLRATGEPGFVLFSSGSSGQPKAILHALPRFLEKFRKPRHCYRTINFLQFDHIGGLNTLLYTMANLGTIVVPIDRSVKRVCEAVQTHKVELLPTSPSFLNLLLLAEAHKEFDLSSLELITYGTEVMPDRTLTLANAAFPHATFQQTYGLSELGILRSKSESNNSLFVKVGGESYQTKVVNGTLRIRAKSSMLGYLNAPSPFDEEGWFDTGDEVIQEGDYYRFLGRNSDIINVGGQKVYPAEVEKVIAGMPGVIDVTVAGEAHLLLGQIVVAKVQLEEPVPVIEMRRRIAEYCKGRLQPFMVPSKVKITEDSTVNYRFKKIRR